MSEGWDYCEQRSVFHVLHPDGKTVYTTKNKHLIRMWNREFKPDVFADNVTWDKQLHQAATFIVHDAHMNSRLSKVTVQDDSTNLWKEHNHE